jgi:hypothetical protein
MSVMIIFRQDRGGPVDPLKGKRRIANGNGYLGQSRQECAVVWRQ